MAVFPFAGTSLGAGHQSSVARSCRRRVGSVLVAVAAEYAAQQQERADGASNNGYGCDRMSRDLSSHAPILVIRFVSEVFGFVCELATVTVTTLAEARAKCATTFSER